MVPLTAGMVGHLDGATYPEPLCSLFEALGDIGEADLEWDAWRPSSVSRSRSPHRDTATVCVRQRSGRIIITFAVAVGGAAGGQRQAEIQLGDRPGAVAESEVVCHARILPRFRSLELAELGRVTRDGPQRHQDASPLLPARCGRGDASGYRGQRCFRRGSHAVASGSPVRWGATAPTSVELVEAARGNSNRTNRH